jgi:hypothetical protein
MLTFCRIHTELMKRIRIILGPPAPRARCESRRELVLTGLCHESGDSLGHFVNHVVGLDTGFGLSGAVLNKLRL